MLLEGLFCGLRLRVLLSCGLRESLRVVCCIWKDENVDGFVI